ncbi:MAG: DNA repair protein RadC [Acetobacteraceae bacterium]|nr:DNA repair protein RadC [Acetobacteraceae bacterium]
MRNTLLDRWWRQIRHLGGPNPPANARPASGRTAGFGERAARLDASPADLEFPRATRATALDRLPDAPHGTPFPSTGPHGHRQRMRERFLERGPDGLADYELLEMLLFLAFKQGDTKPLAKALINRYGSFANVIAAPADDLARLRGLGPHAVTAIKLVQAAAVRSARAELLDRPVLNTWDRLMDYLTAVLAREKVEQFRVLFLDTRNRLLADEALARGTVNHTPVYPREVVKRALELHATALILVHNHPSGDPTPSQDDIYTTKDVQAAATALGIALHDHIIVGNGKWFSFRKTDMLD